MSHAPARRTREPPDIPDRPRRQDRQALGEGRSERSFGHGARGDQGAFAGQGAGQSRLSFPRRPGDDDRRSGVFAGAPRSTRGSPSSARCMSARRFSSRMARSRPSQRQRKHAAANELPRDLDRRRPLPAVFRFRVEPHEAREMRRDARPSTRGRIPRSSARRCRPAARFRTGLIVASPTNTTR